MPPVIRPYNPPVATPQPTPAARPSADARAAQRAFFQQALGDSTPVRTAPPVSAPVIARPASAPAAAAGVSSPQATRVLNRALPEDPPARIMRPGSFVDVKI